MKLDGQSRSRSGLTCADMIDVGSRASVRCWRHFLPELAARLDTMLTEAGC